MGTNRLIYKITTMIALSFVSSLIFAEKKSVAPLNSSQARAIIQNYYNSHGSWAGIYSMQKIRNIRLKHISQTRVEAHVEYSYKATSSSIKHREGIDKRTFVLIRHRQWDVVGMGRYMSGSL